MKKRLLLTMTLCMMVVAVTKAQLGLKVNVNTTEPGTLFVKIQEQIEEVGELSDVTELTITGSLNRDDYNVIRNQMTNLFTLNLAGIDDESTKAMNLGGKRRLKHIVFSTVATEIPSSALNGCDSLQNFTIPQTVTKIGSNAFQNCKALTKMTLPDGMTVIEGSVFADCINLSEIHFPSAITLIKGYAFQNTALPAVVIPATVTEIQRDAFRGCTKLKSITFLDSNVTLRDNVFRNTGLESYTLPKGIIINGDATFGDCPNLKSFTFPDGLTDEKVIGTATLWNCSALEQVRLPADLTTIPNQFFQGTALASIDFPSTVTSIGDNAFNSMTAWKHPVIPNTVTKVGDHLFWGAKIEEIDWPSSVHMIPYETFRSCEYLTRVGIPSTVDSIGWNAFLYCSALPSVRLPEGLYTLNGTFNQCTSLSEVNIPSTVTVLESSTFSNCKFTHIDIPDGVTYIGRFCFENVPLTEVKLPSSLRQMADYAFNGGKYERMVVPEGVISIGGRAFRSDNLKVLDLPSTLLSVGGTMLGDNSQHHPDSVIIRAMVPPYCSDKFFISRDCATTLYVPKPSLSLYQANTDYNNVDNIGTIDIDSPLLNITKNTVITSASDLQAHKYDVNMVATHDVKGLYVYGDVHPSLIIEQGTNFHIGQLNMTFDGNTDWSYRQSKYDTFINRGNVSIDNIDFRCFFTGRYFFTPPFDVNYSDIAPDNPSTPFAVFRYDGAARANVEFNNTWVQVRPDEMLKSGTSYIFMMEKEPYQDANGKWSVRQGYLHLKSHKGGTNNFTTNSDVTVPLNHYAAEFPHNRNWNLIGMPFPSFLDIRGLDYDGPFMILNPSRYQSGWKAISALDDEYVLFPLDAMFIQCPDNVSNITFSADRRQINNTFVRGATQNSHIALRRADKNRQRTVFNLTLQSENAEDEATSVSTRFVINPEATLHYDIGRDAPIFNDSSQPVNQLYTLGDGVAYAINERPLDNGLFRLGLQVTQAGTYTISLRIKDNAFSDSVWLIDNEENTRTALNEESYSFTVDEALESNTRFLIALGDANPTAITDIDSSALSVRHSMFYNLQGLPISTPTKGIYIRDGKKFVK